MGLRFMQNAQRAKQQAQVELEQAKVKDEAEWEVSQEVKDAWGIGSSSSARYVTTRFICCKPTYCCYSASSIVHEASYLPFLFSTSVVRPSDDSQSKPKGRRSFNTKGKEVEAQKVRSGVCRKLCLTVRR